MVGFNHNSRLVKKYSHIVDWMSLKSRSKEVDQNASDSLRKHASRFHCHEADIVSFAKQQILRHILVRQEPDGDLLELQGLLTLWDGDLDQRSFPTTQRKAGLEVSPCFSLALLFHSGMSHNLC
jgi:hypothetical protein